MNGRWLPAMRSSGRSVGLDAVRAIACLMVFVCHASVHDGDGSFAGLKNGVMLFFALSGYLLYRPFVRGDVDLKRYAIHRIARILPAYLLALIGVSLLTGSPVFGSHPLAYLTFTQNYDASLWQGFLGVSWTLVLEVQFYVFLPILALIVKRSALRLSIIAALSFLGAIEVWSYASTADPRLPSSIFPFVLWAFTPGMFVALVERRWFAHPAVLVAGVVLLFYGTGSQWVSIDLLSGVGAGLVVAWTATRQPNLGRFSVLASIGAALTYAAYLWHVDIIERTPNVATAVVATLAIASLSYLVVERPVLRAAHQTGRGDPAVQSAITQTA